MIKKTQLALAAVLILIFCLAFTTVTFASTGTKSEKITYRNIGIVVNGVEIAPRDANGNSTEPFIRNADGSTYLPVRAVSDALGLSVEWKEKTNTIVLRSGQSPVVYKNPVKTSKSVTASLTYRDIKIKLDGYEVKLVNANGGTVEPFIMGGSTYIPVRAVAEALGCSVGWDGKTNTVTLTKASINKPEVSSVGISKESMTMSPGTTSKLSATATPTNAKDSQIYWTSNKPEVASVDENGNVTAKSVGFAYITAYTANGKSASCGVTVTDTTTVTISRTAITLSPGEAFKLNADSKPVGQQIYWTSNKPEVATVDGSGNVTAKGAGSAYITAYTAAGKSISCLVTVKKKQYLYEMMGKTYGYIKSIYGSGYSYVQSEGMGRNLYFSNIKTEFMQFNNSSKTPPDSCVCERMAVAGSGIEIAKGLYTNMTYNELKSVVGNVDAPLPDDMGEWGYVTDFYYNGYTFVYYWSSSPYSSKSYCVWIYK